MQAAQNTAPGYRPGLLWAAGVTVTSNHRRPSSLDLGLISQVTRSITGACVQSPSIKEPGRPAPRERDAPTPCP